MNHDIIKKIIYSKSKVYRKEKKNPYALNTMECLMWRCEQRMIEYDVNPLLGNPKYVNLDYTKLSDNEISTLLMEDRFMIIFHRYPLAKEPYEKLKPLPFLSK